MVPGCSVFDTHGETLPWPPVRLVLIAVPDSEIPAAARLLAAGGLPAGTAVLHTSGLHTADLLAPCREAGAFAASWHPLQSFPAGDDAVELEGVWCAVEGDAEAVTAAEAISRELGMRPWRIEAAAKARYHAAAALAANLSHVLVVAAGRILGETGLPAKPPSSALEPLMMTSLQAALGATGLESLTGPMARGDAATLARHLEVLPPELAQAYLHLAAFVAGWTTAPQDDSIDPRRGDV